MFSHNDQKYIKFVKVLYCLRICICCNSMINQALSYQYEQKINTNIPNQNPAKEMTYEDNQVPRPIAMESSEISTI